MKRIQGWCLIALVHAAGASLAYAVPPGTGLPVEASFDPNGSFDDAGLPKPDRASPHAARAWPFADDPHDIDARQLAKRDAAIQRVLARGIPLTPADTPNYFMYWGVPFAMSLDSTRLAVMLDDGVQAELQAAAAAQAVAAVGSLPPVIESRHNRRAAIVTFARPLGNAGAVNDAIERLLNVRGITFVAPVFSSDEVPGGIAYPTPGVLVRVRPEFEGKYLITLGAAAPNLTAEWDTLGSMPGAARLVSASRNGFAVMAQANALSEHPTVKWAEPAFVGCAAASVITPDDDYFGDWWQHRNPSGYDMSTDDAWTFYGFGSSNVKALVLDSGIETNHPDINQLPGRDFTNNLPGGSAGGGPDYQCDNHGTAVAGCISEIGNNSVGGIGICPECRSISGKVGYDDESSPCNPSWSWAADSTIAAISWGVSQGVSVTNSSWSAWPHSPGVEDEFQTAAVTHGVLNFASTGNDSSEGISWPSSAPYVYAVGAVTSTGARASFSNWGAGIDFTGPGASVPTTDRSAYLGYSQAASPQGDYAYVNGTSFASPTAAGLAAYLKSVFPFASRTQIFAMMRDGCQDTGAPGYDIYYGHGRIDAYNSAALNTPAGDSCSGPIVITSASFNPALLDTTWATAFANEPQAPCESGGGGESSSVFYWYFTPSTGLVNVNTNGSNYDTVLSVWSGCGTTSDSGGSFTSPTLYACDDDSGTGTASQISNLWVDDAKVLIIKVSKYGTSAGGGTLDFNFSFTPAPPPNDFCGDATVIPLTTFGNYNPATYSVELATRSTCEGSESCGTAGSNGHSVWYEFTPTADGVVTVDTSGSTYDTVLHLYQVGSFACPSGINGNCAFGPSLLACDDDSGTNTDAKIINLGISAGITYKIKVSGRSSAWGRLHFNLTYGSLSPPPNDACANATVLDPAPGLHVMPDVITNRAGIGLCDEASSCGDPGRDSNSVWYRITPAEDVLFTASTQGSNYDTVLTLYRGGCVNQVGLQCIGRHTEIACNDNVSAGDRDSLVQQVPLAGGQVYHLMICDRDPVDEGGNLEFNYLIEVPQPPPTCDPDVNCDGVPDQGDVACIILAVAGDMSCYCQADPDFNRDGVPDQGDVADVILVVAGAPCP